MKPLKPKINPADTPAVRHILLLCLDDISLKVSMLDKMKCEPRETISVSRPQEKAAATAELTDTRQAIFENGKILVKNHE